MENEKELKFIVETEETGVRLDQFLVQKLPEITRSFLQKRIKEGKVLVNGKNAKAGNKLSQNDCVVITLEPPKELAIEPENIPLDILFEDEKFRFRL